LGIDCSCIESGRFYHAHAMFGDFLPINLALFTKSPQGNKSPL
jgi:hypothetical protein